MKTNVLLTIVLLVCFSAHSQNNVALYDEVQAIYEKSRQTSDCGTINAIIQELEQYYQSEVIIPDDKRSTVSGLFRKKNTTIRNMVDDRIYKIMRSKMECYPRRIESANTTDQIENISKRSMGVTPSAYCDILEKKIDDISAFNSNSQLISPHLAFTIRYPNKTENATVRDLVVDRVQRLKYRYPECYPEASNFRKGCIGTFNYTHQDVAYEIVITNDNDNLKAEFTKHRFTKDPFQYDGGMLSNDEVLFSFDLGDGNQFDMRIFHANGIYELTLRESWATPNKSVFNIQPGPWKDPNSVDVTFQNTANRTIKLYWVNDTEEVFYKDIDPGKSYTQGTYLGHKWRIKNAGRIMKEYTATGEPNQTCVFR